MSSRPLALALALSALVSPEVARADDLFLAGVELGAAAPVAAPDYGLGWGVAFSGAVMVALDRVLLPSLRLEALALTSGALTPEQDVPTARRRGDMGMVLTAGLRFRPHGIAAPGEASAASCFWAEVNVGGAFGLAPSTQLALEGAVGFHFDVGDVDLGPYVRVLHAWNERSEHVLLSFGIELVLFDVARER